MRSGVCPKCGSSEVYVSRHPGGIWNFEASYLKFRAPAHHGDSEGLRTLLCADCGYLEWYLEDKDAIALITADPDGSVWPRIVPAGWNPDPAGRHELRYWDGLSWTSRVSDRGKQSEDPHPL